MESVEDTILGRRQDLLEVLFHASPAAWRSVQRQFKHVAREEVSPARQYIGAICEIASVPIIRPMLKRDAVERRVLFRCVRLVSYARTRMEHSRWLAGNVRKSRGQLVSNYVDGRSARLDWQGSMSRPTFESPCSCYG